MSELILTIMAMLYLAHSKISPGLSGNELARYQLAILLANISAFYVAVNF